MRPRCGCYDWAVDPRAATTPCPRPSSAAEDHIDIDANRLNALADQLVGDDLSGDQRAILGAILARVSLAEPGEPDEPEAMIASMLPAQT